jgi:hypothetical protein
MSQTSKEPAVRNFRVTPSQYELFKFTVVRPTTLFIRMIATAPVNLLLLDNEDRAEYESGSETTTYTASWGRRIHLEVEEAVTPGTWYLVVEGSTELSSGRIEVLQEQIRRSG